MLLWLFPVVLLWASVMYLSVRSRTHSVHLGCLYLELSTCDQIFFFTFHCRTQNNLFIPENVARLNETFSRAHDLMEADRNVVLGKHVYLSVSHYLKKLWLNLLNVFPSPGLRQHPLDISDAPVYRTNVERMQGFLTSLYEYR